MRKTHVIISVLLVFAFIAMIIFMFSRRENLVVEKNEDISVVMFNQPFNNNYRIFNVSSSNYKDNRILLCFRLSNITKCSRRFRMNFSYDDNVVKNYVLLADVDEKTLEITKYQKLFLPQNIQKLLQNSIYSNLVNKDPNWGVEDVRIIYDKDTDMLLFVGNLPVVHDYIQNIMYLGYGKKDENGEWQIIKETLLYPNFDSINKIQKNWIPILDDGFLFFIYSIDPFIVVQCNPNTGSCHIVKYLEHIHNFNLKSNETLRGSTQGIKVDDKYYAVGHLTIEIGNQRKYQHFFMRFDSSFKTIEFSQLFCFDEQLNYCTDIQFAMGLTYVKDLDTFYITYGENDCDSKLYKISKENVDNLFLLKDF